MKHAAAALWISLLPAPTFVLKDKVQQHQMTLAPPPINYTREEIPVDDKILVTTFDGERVDLKDKKDQATTLRPEILLFVGLWGLAFWIWGIVWIVRIVKAVFSK